MSPENTPLDTELMRLTFGQDKNFMAATMRIYMRDAPTLLQEALAAVKEGNNPGLVSKAHALKGITGYFTRGAMYGQCLELETLGRENGLPLQAVHALGLWSSISKGLQEMLAAMVEYLPPEEDV